MNDLLKSLCSVHSPSGEEIHMKKFLLNYFESNLERFAVEPEIYCGEEFQDCLLVVFGRPRVAAFAHMDTTGFTVRYRDQLISIGSPEIDGDEILTGADPLGEIECRLNLNDENQLHYKFGRGIHSGTSLIYQENFRDHRSHIVSPYLDNRVGIYNLLKVAETLRNGVLVFSSWEEHGGGSVPYLVKFLYERYRINKMLVSDVTWTSDGIALGGGVVISNRDRNIPRKSFVNRITDITIENEVPFQIEVEAFGSSDAKEIQQSPYPIDWCFVGPPVENAHSNREKISKKDLKAMVDLYELLMESL